LGVLNRGEELKAVLFASRFNRDFDNNVMRSGTCSCPDPDCYGAFKTPQGTFLSPHASIHPFRHRDIAEPFVMSSFENEHETTPDIQNSTNSINFQTGNQAAVSIAFHAAPASDRTQGCLYDLQ